VYDFNTPGSSAIGGRTEAELVAEGPDSTMFF
jgi:hypothetical protein